MEAETNILKAMENLIKNPTFYIKESYTSNNRINNIGESFEEYIKNLFANTLLEKNFDIKENKFLKTFSYLGGKNNPPDAIIRGGDAIEIKKTESLNSSLSLNSSYPRSKLKISDPMITSDCRKCENWNTKDIIYVVGTIKGESLKNLFMVYGEDYAAKDTIYEGIKQTIKRAVEDTPNINFNTSKEFGHVNDIDFLGATYLRVRGMWGIKNPNKVFSYVYKPQLNNNFNFCCIVNKEKYNSFPKSDRKMIEELNQKISNFTIQNIKIKDANNPNILKEAKLFEFFTGTNHE